MAWGETDYYDSNSVPQRTGAEGAIPAFVDAAEALASEGALVPPAIVANYGCTGGVNSLQPFGAAIEAMRQAGYEDSIVVAQIDLPSNDFSALFHTLENDPRSYQRRPGVYSVAVGKSFFEQCLPGGSVALGWCTHAAHWLTQRPSFTELEGHVSVGMASPAAQAPWSAIAVEDWHRFLVNRAAELQPGGRVLIELAIRDEAGAFGCEPLYRVADDGFAELVDRGLLSQEAAANMVVPVFCRSQEELRAPFSDPALAGLLRLDSIRPRYLPDPFLTALETSGDAADYARAWTATLRAFTEDQFFHPAGRDQALADAYYATVEKLIEADPMAATNQWYIADVVVSRR
jgi:salicylate 1-O-methyltransferase